MHLRNRVNQVLSGQPTDRLAQATSVFLIALILLNVLAVMAESVEDVHLQFAPWLSVFETFSVCIFTVEYLLRLWSCTSQPEYAHPLSGRIRYAATPLALIDLLAILPALLTWAGIDLRVLRLLRLARMLRLAKLGRYSKALQLMGNAAQLKREELVLSLAAMIFMLILAASLMYMAEHEQQPEAFSSIPATMWWAAATLTTVGYGDVYPITAIGKVLGSVIAILGIGLFALPAGIIASAFIELRGQQNSTTLSHCPHCGKPLTGGHYSNASSQKG